MNVVNTATSDLSTQTLGVAREGFRKRGVAPIDGRLGARLRMVREERRVSRRDMAGALGISMQQLSKYEVGSNRMSVSFVYEAAAFLGIAVASLLVDADDSRAPVAPAVERALEEEAVLRFVARNIRSIGARKDILAFLGRLSGAAPAHANGGGD